MRIYRESDYGDIGKLASDLAFQPEEMAEKREQVRSIIAAVREEGDLALVRFTREFDGLDFAPEDLRVPGEELEYAERAISGDYASTVRTIIRNVTNFHKLQKMESLFWDSEDGARIGQLVRPINRVGIYIPGGKAIYPSTAIMAIVPARIAGVPEIVACVSPGPQGSLDPRLLYVLYALKVKEVYRVGGAQAIAAMALGTESIRRVDKVVGPGNIYVSLAKLELCGEVGIDFFAGPSEVVVLADEQSRADLIALDMLAQLEHGSGARAILITNSEGMLEKVRREIEGNFQELFPDRERREEADSGCLLVGVESLESGIELINLIAPEHVEVLTEDFTDHVSRIRNASTVFLGPDSPVCLGDYVIGTNHILPTCGGARFSSPLSVYDFLKQTNVVFSNSSSNRKLEKFVETMANTEGLKIHYLSLRNRNIAT